jgi:putative transposase
MVAYIDAHRGVFGVEPICEQLPIASSTYHAAKSRPPSARAFRDAVMIPILVGLWTANYKVYGAHKLWKSARRAGHDIGRDQVARLMRSAGIEGVRRRRKVRTTRSDDLVPRPPDLVERDFTADRPNRLWVTDLTYVPTWSGFAYVCFIVDAYSRAIVGWRVASNMRTDMGLVAHSDAGSQFTSVRYGERLAELGAVPSVGSVGDSYDNALAETVNGLYKTELIRGPGQRPWRTVEDVELATLSWVHWHNTERLHGYLRDVPPAEFEDRYYRRLEEEPELVGNQ